MCYSNDNVDTWIDLAAATAKIVEGLRAEKKTEFVAVAAAQHCYAAHTEIALIVGVVIRSPTPTMKAADPLSARW